MKVNIVCVLKSGSKIGYNTEWVYKLYRSVNRNVTVPINFFCLSDTVLSGIQTIPLEPYDPEPAFGFWYKIQLFKHKEFVNLPTIYFDLDLVICQNIDDDIHMMCNQLDFLMLWEDNSRRGVPSTANSSIMYWNGDYRYIWSKFASNPQEFYTKHNVPESFGDQGFIKSNVTYSLLQDKLPADHFAWANKKEGEPLTTKFLVFTKPSCKPHRMTRHRLVAQHWI